MNRRPVLNAQCYLYEKTDRTNEVRLFNTTFKGVPLSRETGVPRGVQAKRCHSRRKGSSKEEVGLKRKGGGFRIPKRLVS